MLGIKPVGMPLLWTLLLCSLCLNLHQFTHRQWGGVDTRELCSGDVASNSQRKLLDDLPAGETGFPTGDIQVYDLYSNLTNPPRGNGFLVPPRERHELGRMLEFMGGFKVGVELGVQRGDFARTMLDTWPSCTKYYLVDLWAQQQNYNDFANMDDAGHLKLMRIAQENLAIWKQKTVFIKNYTSVAADLITEQVDFVYVDARHDYCGCKEDIELYWPKIRPGGIMAGHDYTSAYLVRLRSGQNWEVCMDGSKNDGAVQGAVDEFAHKHGLTVSVTWGEFHQWRTWIIRKP